MRPAISRNVWRDVMVVLLLAASSAAGCAAGAAMDDAAGDVALKPSVSQYGITWTFSKPVPVGQFVNGDYYVVGPVTVTAIDPKPLRGAEVPQDQVDASEARRVQPDQRLRNGSMLNPAARQNLAYDSGIRNFYTPELDARLPIAMKPTDSLVSTISLKRGEKVSFPYHSSGKRPSGGDGTPIKVAAVLTCVARPQPRDAFRPSYCDRGQTIYRAGSLRRDLLPRLPRVEGTPDPVEFAAVFKKPWVDTAYFNFAQPAENMPLYGQWVGQAVGDAAVLLCMDFTPEQKKQLLINFVQVGIDYWGVVGGGHPGWEGWGGMGSGRKFPIVFAGFMLADETMANPNKAFPLCNFGEDNQTMYGDCWTGAKVVFSGQSGIHADGTIPRPKWGPYEHLHPSEWKAERNQMNFQSEAYRRANTSCCWVGEALAARIMKLEKDWNHNAFFDYVDRWMFEDDKEFRRVIHQYYPGAGGEKNALVDAEEIWFHQGYAGEPCVKAAWNKYRTMPGMPPTDGWKEPHQNPPAAGGKQP